MFPSEKIKQLNRTQKIQINFEYYMKKFGMIDTGVIGQLFKYFTNLKKAIFQFSALNLLESSDIKGLAEGFTHFNNLRSFTFQFQTHLEQGNIVGLSDWFKPLVNLEELNIITQQSIASEKSVLAQLKEVGKGIQYLKNLKIFSLKGLNSVLQSDLTSLLLIHLKDLKSLNILKLDINFNQPSEIKAAECLRNIIQNNIGITELQLYVSTTSISQIKIISQIITEAPNLKKLQFEFKDLHYGQQAAFFYSFSLKTLQNLQELYLNIKLGSQIKERGAEVIGDSLKNLVNLKKLSIQVEQNNSLGKKGIKMLGSSFKNMQQLKTLNLNLYDQTIYICGAESLFIQLGYLNNLDHLQIFMRIGRDEVFDPQEKQETRLLQIKQHEIFVNQSLIEFFKRLSNLQQLKIFRYQNDDSLLSNGRVVDCINKKQRRFLIRLFPLLVKLQ